MQSEVHYYRFYTQRTGKFSWSLYIDWSVHYAALCQYDEEHGTCNVPHSEVYECNLPGLGEHGSVYHYHENLGNWLNRQRQAMKGRSRGKLKVDEQAQLQKLVDEGK